MYEKQKQLDMIRKYDFALYELQLYLDTHPDCPGAGRLWRNYRNLRNNAVNAYVRKYGPIQPLQSDTEGTWNWTDGPWPWEKEAN